MRLLILSPWENDWDENIAGTPKNYYLLRELRQHSDVEVDWVYIGEGQYANFENIRFIRFKDFKPDRKYNLILSLFSPLHNTAIEIAKKNNVFYVNKHFGFALNPLIRNIKNPLIQIKYHELFNCFKKQADFYISEEDGSNAKLFLMEVGIPSYKIRINDQPRPDEVKYDPTYRKEGFINVGYIGAISKVKGKDEILRIIREILKNKNIHLILAVIRSDHIVDELSKEFENITIVRNLSYFQTYKFYSSIDFLINPVKYGNITRPTVEALSYGKPIIAFDVSLWTKIEHLRNGILVKPFDTKSFVNWVFELSTNKELLKELSKNALLTADSIITFSEAIKDEVLFLKSLSC